MQYTFCAILQLISVASLPKFSQYKSFSFTIFESVKQIEYLALPCWMQCLLNSFTEQISLPTRATIPYSNNRNNLLYLVM